MAYPSIPIFQGIPAIYSLQPSRHHKRRTATDVVAGCFDPPPPVVSDSSRDSDSSSTTSSISIQESATRAATTHATQSHKTTFKKQNSRLTKKERHSNSMPVLAGARDGKGKGSRQVRTEEKENATSAVSDGEPPGSLSPPPISPDGVSPLLPGIIPKDRPKSSGFWRGRSSNTSVSPPPHPLKRKRSAPIRPDATHSWAGHSKRARLSEPAADGVSKTSSQNFVASSRGPSSPPSSVTSSNFHDYKEEPQYIKTDAPKLYEVARKAGVTCKVCGKFAITVHFMEQHLAQSHSDIIDMNVTQRSAPKKTRGPRRNVAIKKGWKGWVEEELEPQKLILLDKPEVLPERTTRSGRKI